jgi:hypothetical protein
MSGLDQDLLLDPSINRGNQFDSFGCGFYKDLFFERNSATRYAISRSVSGETNSRRVIDFMEHERTGTRR